ncbi:PstS family phosphate ABC transporter substrate-binding protein [Halomonas sp. WWR20]
MRITVLHRCPCRLLRLVATVLACVAMATAPVWAASEPTRVSGTLSSLGSDTLAGMMMHWGERFTERYPGVRLQLQASGSATAPPALAEGTTRLGAMSRRMTLQEQADFVAQQGYAPTAVPVALDALAVFVHRDNPLVTLSFAQLDALFSATRRCGAPSAISHWGELGLKRPWTLRSVDRYGRNAASGTYGVFQRQALCGGDFRNDVNALPGSAAVVAAVGTARGGIGYAGLGYVTPMVHVVALEDAMGQAWLPSAINVANGDYPLSRTLYLYVNVAPNKALPALERAFLDLVLSPVGQAAVEQEGFIALPEETLREARRKLGLPVTASS